MALTEFYLNRNIKCCNALSEYEKEIKHFTDKDSILLFNKIWLLRNKEIYKSIINKPKGLNEKMIHPINRNSYINHVKARIDSMKLETELLKNRKGN